jgi:beta-glucosidase
LSEATSAWQDTSLAPGERAKRLVEAMTLEQKIAQLHGAMETIDIYALTAQAAESGADMDQLAAQIQVERHVKAIDELGIPGSGSPTARWVSAWATVPRARRPPPCQ